MIRGMGLRGAVAVNVITMMGAGPLVTIPLVVAAQHGSPSLWPWIVGALIAACDGLVYAELASLFPRSGGTYAYLREAFGAHGAGRWLAFLFAWQFAIFAPLTLATGYIGFAQYAAYLVPAFAAREAQWAVAAVVALVTIALLYRAIGVVARTAIVLGVVAVATVALVAATGIAHPLVSGAAPLASGLGATTIGGLGAALVITLYDYAGYNDVCALGDEIVAPVRTIPRAIVVSILVVAALYAALSLGVLHAVTASELATTTSVASLVLERAFGVVVAHAATVAILAVIFASTYGLLLASARIVYAAASDGVFFSPFAHLDRHGKFPDRALLLVGLLAVPAVFFPLDQVIAWLQASIVLVQGVLQVVALVVVRRTRPAAPFRAWLYPLPAIVAGIGWLFIFANAGASAIVFACVCSIVGSAVYFGVARRVRWWPFARAAAVAGLVLVLGVGGLARGAAAAEAPWTSTSIVPMQTTATIVHDGKPFFVWGAAFFYERIPRDRWAATLKRYHRCGITTIDLYIPWNWHETSDGVYDFDGSTNPRRDFDGLLKLIHAEGYAIVVRPGPVIRNEWRNGGYPAWLLTQPAYDMPLHDILEGRYPATATLQNAHSDDAAAEWMRNATHMKYAERWLHRVAHELQPYANDVIAWQLDDDQAAYIDNQTWPAPHLQAYLEKLASIVRSDVGPTLPLFINTYEMKVPASSPVLAFGNWYQSEAYEFGEHDRTELEFATALLQTQPHAPIVASEFQAGWLQGAGDAYPRAISPESTQLALHTLIQLGAHGVIDFPLQDTLAPAGWEAPFSNAFYDWDAALDILGRSQPRDFATASFGSDIDTYGSVLARAHRVVDAAIVWPVSAYDEAAISNDDVFSAVARTKAALRFCRLASLTCDLVDLRYSDDRRLAAYPIVLIPQRNARLPFRPQANERIVRLRRSSVVETDAVPFPTDAIASARARADRLLRRADRTRAIDGVPGAVLLETDDPAPTRLIDIVNLGDAPVIVGSPVRGGARRMHVAMCVVASRVEPHAAVLVGEQSVFGLVPGLVAASPGTCAKAGATITDFDPGPQPTARPDGIPLRDTLLYPIPTAIGKPNDRFSYGAYRADVFRDGSPLVILDGWRQRVALSPDAGGRIVALVDRRDGINRVTTVGGLRDDVTLQFPASPRDYIAKYTHDYPAGFFNRSYAADNLNARTVISCGGSGSFATARETYTAPDVVGGPLTITKEVALQSLRYSGNVVSVHMSGTFGAHAPTGQLLTSRTSLAGGRPATRGTWSVAVPDERAIPPGTTIDVASGGLAFFGADGRATRFSWAADAGITARVIGRADDVDVVLTFAAPAPSPDPPVLIPFGSSSSPAAGTFTIATGQATTAESRAAFAAPLRATGATPRPLGSCI
jgi:amino acid transporter